MKIDELSQEERRLVEEHRKEKARKKATSKTYKKASDYSPEEKQRIFDNLHEMATGELGFVRENKTHSKDVRYYFYEAVMELLGDDVWNIMKALQG